MKELEKPEEIYLSMDHVMRCVTEYCGLHQCWIDCEIEGHCCQGDNWGEDDINAKFLALVITDIQEVG